MMLSKFEQVCNEKGSEVLENELRSSPIPRVFCITMHIQQRFGRRLYPIPPLNWIKGKKRISGILYVNTIPRTKQRVQEEILFLPLSLSLLFFLSLSFFFSTTSFVPRMRLTIHQKGFQNISRIQRIEESKWRIFVEGFWFFNRRNSVRWNRNSRIPRNLPFFDADNFKRRLFPMRKFTSILT